MSAIRNPNLGPSAMRQRRRRLFFIRLYIFSFILLVVVFGLAIFSGSEKLKIQTIIVSGNAAVSSDDVLKIANRDMDGRYAYLFAKSNSIIFPRFKIKSDLLKEIKTIKDLDINWDDWQRISLKITERKPHSVWCGNDINISNNQCYFVDKDGLLYSEAPTFSGSMFVKDYGYVSSSTGTIGQYYLKLGSYNKIFSLIDLLDQKNIKVISVYFDGSDYKFNLEGGPVVIFNDKNGFEQSFSNLFSAIDTKNLDLVSGVDKINYIDLRFDNIIVVGKK